MKPDSAVKSKMPEARRNPGAAQASECEVSKSLCALAGRYDEVQHSLEALLINVWSEVETHRLHCGGIVPCAIWRSQLRNPA